MVSSHESGLTDFEDWASKNGMLPPGSSASAPSSTALASAMPAPSLPHPAAEDAPLLAAARHGASAEDTLRGLEPVVYDTGNLPASSALPLTDDVDTAADRRASTWPLKLLWAAPASLALVGVLTLGHLAQGLLLTPSSSAVSLQPPASMTTTSLSSAHAVTAVARPLPAAPSTLENSSPVVAVASKRARTGHEASGAASDLVPNQGSGSEKAQARREAAQARREAVKAKREAAAAKRKEAAEARHAAALERKEAAAQKRQEAAESKKPSDAAERKEAVAEKRQEAAEARKAAAAERKEAAAQKHKEAAEARKEAAEARKAEADEQKDAVASKHREAAEARKAAAEERQAAMLEKREAAAREREEKLDAAKAKREQAVAAKQPSGRSSGAFGTGGPAPAPRNAGILRINSRPWAQVFIDGRLVGNTPQLGMQIAPGEHQVRLVNGMFGMSKSFNVSVKAGERVTRVEMLEE